MKLLFLSPRIPYPPNKGDRVRLSQELQALIERGHEVHLLAFAGDMDDLNYQVDLGRMCATVGIVPLRRVRAVARALFNLVFMRSLARGYFASRRMRRLVKRAASDNDFDAVFVSSSPMAQYVPRELLSRAVIDMADVDSERWRDRAGPANPVMSRIYSLEWKRLREYEYKVIARFANTVVTTGREAALLDRIDEFTRRARLRTMANGVDLERFQPLFQSPDTISPRLVFVGAMDHFANVEGARYFAEEVFPLIRSRESRAKFSIIGANPTDEVKKMARYPGVIVAGEAPDARSYLREATLCVVPLRHARGAQNEILEAMAAGKAVIASPEAVAGLRVVNGDHLMIADSPRKFADATLEVIHDASLRESLETRARQFVEAEHDWKSLLQRMVDLVESVGTREHNLSRSNIRAIAGN
ncbi:MAG TPA: TIGR03087 family PEP-CTERM/XrtA system glycosyltransferase [Blastocatellia bacterium]|jgi:sugar transferase (PEP-CTERM/EpsH1 system associated)|nr:TIGR03087 family PEP-CTERM/XrtA system glycosyltransferase [Blastocatellia bacterium]